MSRNLTRVASTALVAGLASFLLAGPADAMLPHDPNVGGVGVADRDTGDIPWMDLGIGALGGLALAGAGTAAASRVRHRQSVAT